MKLSHVLILLAVVLGLVACDNSKQFNFANGGGVNSSDLKGQYLVVNYWAAWCKPCIEEIPELNELDHESNIRVIGMHYDKPKLDELQKQMRELNVEFSNIDQRSSTVNFEKQFSIERPKALPTTFVFSPQLELIETLQGPQSKEDILAVIHSKK